MGSEIAHQPMEEEEAKGNSSFSLPETKIFNFIIFKKDLFDLFSLFL
jgi:hypothetical protein